MRATDAKTQKIEPGPISFFLNDGQKFRRQCVTWLTQGEVVFQMNISDSVCNGLNILMSLF